MTSWPSQIIHWPSDDRRVGVSVHVAALIQLQYGHVERIGVVARTDSWLAKEAAKYGAQTLSRSGGHDPLVPALQDAVAQAGKPTVLHTHGRRPTVAGCLQLSRRTAFATTVHASPHVPRRPRNIMLDSAYRACMRCANGVWFVSEQVARDWAVPGRVIPNWLYMPNSQTYGLRQPKGDSPVFAFVGRLSPVKGPDRAVAVMHAVVRRLPGSRLIVVGDGPLNPQLQAMAQQFPANTVHLAGYQEDPWGVAHAADALVMPSRQESFGLSAAEAMSTGLAVYHSGVGVLSELCGPAGRALNWDDPEACAEEIAREWLTGRMQQRARSARRVAAGLQANRRKVSEVHRFYETVLGRST